MWPQIRAGLIALAIFFGLVDGLPLPPRNRGPALTRPLVEPIRRVQHRIMTPLAWIRPRFRVAQRWALYQNPRAQRYRLIIDGLDDTGWHVVFRAGETDSSLLDYTRPRGAWDPRTNPPGQYAAFARWIGARYKAASGFRVVRLRHQIVDLDADGIHPRDVYAWPVIP